MRPFDAEIGQDGFGGTVSSRFPSQIETLPQVRLDLAHAPGAGVVESPSQEENEHHSDLHHGYTCQQRGCKMVAKTPHGFARHLKTHGYGAIGRHFNR